MAKNNGTIKRVTRKRSSAPKTARKPRLSEEAVAELAGMPVEEQAAAPVVMEPVEVEVEASAIIDETPIAAVEPEIEPEIEIELEVLPPAPEPLPAPAPPRAVSVWPEPPRLERQPDHRFRRVAFVRAMMHRLRRAAVQRAAPIARRLEARFPRLVALRDSLRRWF